MMLSLLILGASVVETLQSSLDPQSVGQHLALYELYPDTLQGQKSLAHAWTLLAGGPTHPESALPATRLFSIVQQFAVQTLDRNLTLSPAELSAVEKVGARLKNRQLGGHAIWSEAEMLALSPDQVDVGRGMLLSLLGEEREQIRSYEALLDLMALQILAHTSFDASPRGKIAAINHFLFDEMYLRFPPHSLYAKDIDLYTFLPSVLDSRRGVCLGVSALYFCIAQRLALPLEAVTPPGHIYVRYRDEHEQINIETTARGIDLPNEVYLGVGTPTLDQRNEREVIGMTFFNQAAALWQHDHIPEAVAAYEKARLYLPGDPLVAELLGYTWILNGQKKAGLALLKTIDDPNATIQDLLAKKSSIEGIAAIYRHVDETRDSILEKQAKIDQILTKYPKFRGGWFHLAVTWLQLGREREAQEALLRFHELDDTDSTVEYLLAATSMGRNDLNKAWAHLHKAEELTAEENPRALLQLRRTLRVEAPE